VSWLITNKSIENLSAMMNWAAERQKILQHNLANADTPNYQRRDLDFGQELANKVNRLPLKQTHPRHLGASTADHNHLVSEWGVVRVDQNGVDPEVEMVTTVQNFLYYQGLTQEINSQFSRLRAAIQGR
jgi:flagellar basal-body rod protein FlgB